MSGLVLDSCRSHGLEAGDLGVDVGGFDIEMHSVLDSLGLVDVL
jgi:hypothetical protein